MQIPIYHINAFTKHVFCGNPAAVCLLSEWLSENDLVAIAKENNLPVTAFLVRDNEKFSIRWITPEYELDLCGHGSLSAGFVIFHFLEPTWHKVDLQSRTELLHVTRHHDLITLNFPVKNLETISLPLLAQGLGLQPIEMYQHKQERCLAVFNNEEEIKQLKPDIPILKNISHRGITVTAKGNSVDFVSRTFYPHKSIFEDPVTGSAHCVLAPYWAERLKKNEFQARQVSQRGGDIICKLEGQRVLISGNAVVYSTGVIRK